MNYRCVQCGGAVIIPSREEGSLACSHCGFTYIYANNYLKYDGDGLLLKHFRKRYLLNKVLNNNGLLSYIFIKEGSLSLSVREDVSNFKRYISSYISHGKILDVGCGILELPGYLNFEEKEGFEFYGIDPIDNKSFRGIRITGCAEFMPFFDNSLDAVIFATSLDHVCSIERTVHETHRVLSEGGKVFVWMSDRSTSFFERLKNMEDLLLNRLRLRFGFKVDKFIPGPDCNVRVNDFVIYPNYTVFYVPNGAKDPFHIHLESPKIIIKLFKKTKFTFVDIQSNKKNEIFLCFEKITKPI